MKNKKTHLLILVAFLVALAGATEYTLSDKKVIRTINVQVQPDNDNIWRIRDEKGNNAGSMKVNRKDKDTIYWRSNKSDLIFTFSKNVNNYFIFDEGMFSNGITQGIKRNETLRLTLKDNAPKGTLTYEIYVIEADTLVEGGSPPKLIIY